MRIFPTIEINHDCPKADLPVIRKLETKGFELQAVPRIGEHVSFEGMFFIVEDVVHNIDGNTIRIYMRLI